MVDPRTDILPNAVVTITHQDDAAKTQTLKPATASATGIATFEGLMPGLYTIQATFPGLDPGTVKDVRLKSGDNQELRLTIVLQIDNATGNVTCNVRGRTG